MPNNLYPPIMDTYNPSFLVNIDGTGNKGTGTGRIYFTLSPYSSKEDIKTVWVSMVDAKTNISVVAPATEMLRREAIFEETTADGATRYYVNIYASNLKDAKWSINTLYKVQLRLCDTTDVANTTKDINDNLDHFSEWSTATLLKPIHKHQVSLYRMPQENGKYIFNKFQNTFSGKVDYGNSNKLGETLESFQIKVYDNNNQLYYNSDVCYPDSKAPREFQYQFTKGFSEGQTYTFKVTYISSNLYVETDEYPVQIKTVDSTGLRAKVAATPDPENGRMKITLTVDNSTYNDSYQGNFVLRRSSNDSYFNLWEDIKIFQLNVPSGQVYTEDIFDYTVDSGIFYQYYLSRLYKTEENKYRSVTEKQMLLLNDIFINGNGRQLKIKFNPNISSYAHTILESSVQTIGGQYPFIKRNGNVNYRQIGISGLISYHMDTEVRYTETNDTTLYGTPAINLFTSKEELLKDVTGYEYYFNNKYGDRDFDFILERKFRELVTDFLLDGKPKLFRSPTEKSAIIRLMNVSISPEQSLGRMLYNFSATGHEIDDCTIANLSKHKISPLGVYHSLEAEDPQFVSVPGGLSEQKQAISVAIDYHAGTGLDKLTNIFDKYTVQKAGYHFCYATNVRIKFHGENAIDPYPIQGGFYPTIGQSGQNLEEGWIIYYQPYRPGESVSMQTMILTANMMETVGNNMTYYFKEPLTFLSIAVPVRVNTNEQFLIDCVCCEAKTVNEESFVD